MVVTNILRQLMQKGPLSNRTSDYGTLAIAAQIDRMVGNLLVFLNEVCLEMSDRAQFCKISLPFPSLSSSSTQN